MDDRDKQNLVAGIAVAILIGVSLWLGHLWSEHLKMENCVFSGRRNCHPIAMDQ
jgi:hypothetical protein